MDREGCLCTGNRRSGPVPSVWVVRSPTTRRSNAQRAPAGQFPAAPGLWTSFSERNVAFSPWAAAGTETFRLGVLLSYEAKGHCWMRPYDVAARPGSSDQDTHPVAGCRRPNVLDSRFQRLIHMGWQFDPYFNHPW